METKEITKLLSSLAPLKAANFRLEQYQTDPKAATEFLNFIKATYDVSGKHVADFGCGNGILGIGLLLLGAKKVDFYDIDEKAVETCISNLKAVGLYSDSVFKKDVFDIKNVKYDLIVSNPPFGIQSNFDIDSFLKRVSALSDSSFIIAKDNQAISELARTYGFRFGKTIEIKVGNIAKFHSKISTEIRAQIVYKLGNNS